MTTRDRTSEALAQLDAVLTLHQNLRRQSQHDDLSDLSRTEYSRLMALARAAIERIGGRDSAYSRQADAPIAKYGAEHPINVGQLVGIVAALSEDVRNGYIASVEELAHGELFGDFLEMAAHLLDSGYKDAAAVVAGSALEAHLRQLCKKSGIPTEVTVGADLVPKKADRLNAELAASGAITKLDQKNVTAWLDVRNKAAHGQYDGYVKEQVTLQVAGIRDLLTRVPA